MSRWVLLLTLPVLVVQAQSPVGSRTQDLNFIATQLPKLDPNFFSQLSPSAFGQAVTGLQSNIATLTDAQFYVGLAQLVAMAGDAHTFLSIPTAPGFQQLPLHLRWLDDGVFVTSAGPEYTRSLGARIIAIGAYSIDEVIERLGTVIPHENDQWLHYVAQTYLAQQQILQGLGIVPDGSPTPLTFQSLDGSQFTLSMNASNEARTSLLTSDTGTIPDYLLNSSENYWFKYSAANRMLYFKYNVCESDPAQPFPLFASAILSTIDANPVDTLVFDVRGNTGGDDSVINPLVNGLAQRLPRLRANPAFIVYGAIDKGTFSSAVDDAQVFKQPGLGIPAVLIGEPTGGKPAHFGNVNNFVLPASQIQGQYSTNFIPSPSYLPAGLPSLEPDIAVSIRSTDYFARFDPVLAAVLARSKGPPAAPSGNAITVNGASDRIDQGIAPGSIATSFGMFSMAPDQVLVGGAASQVLAGNASQVSFIVPQTVVPGPAVISIRAAGNEIASGIATITPAGPGIFVLQATDPQQPGAVENQDSSINNASNPTAPGAVIQIFATGYGGDGLPAQVYFGDIPAEVLFSGPIGLGLWQINTRVPTGFSGKTPIFLATGGLASNAVTVQVR